jgi:hypothetical protein
MNFEQSQVWRELTDDPGNYYCNASDLEREQFQDWLKGLLREREVTVDFVKADGDFRSMKCTLSESWGAKYTVNESKSPRKSNPEVCVVWDTAQSAWRSFRWDRIKSIKFDLA